MAAYERAVALKPDLKEAWINMAQVCVRGGGEGGEGGAMRPRHEANWLPFAPHLLCWFPSLLCPFSNVHYLLL